MKQLAEMSLEDLFNITITTAGKREENINDVPASVIVLEREDIKRLGYTSYTDIIQNIPGFFMIDDYYWLGSVNFGVRGFFSTGPMNNIIILVNGVNQMSDKYSDYPDVKINVPVEAIERVEIIRGPMSVMYGTGAFFGAINIITCDPVTKNPENLASVGIGSSESKRMFLRYSGSSDDLSFTINGYYSEQAGIDVPFLDLTSDPTVLTDVGLSQNSSTAGQFDDERKYLNLSLRYKNFQSDISLIETKKDVFDGQPNLSRGTEMTTKAMNAVVWYKKEFSENLASQIKLGYYSHNHIIDYNVFYPNYYEVDMQNTSSYDIEVNLFYDPLETLKTTFGLYRRTVLSLQQVSDFPYYGLRNGDGEIGLPSDESYSTHSVYGQIAYQAMENLKFIGGFRIDHLDDYNIDYTRGVVSPDDNVDYQRIFHKTYSPDNNGFSTVSRLAVLYSYGEHSLKLLWGQAVKQPSYTENYRQILGNYPFLNAAKINTFEVSNIFRLKTGIELSLGYYLNSINNLISTTNFLDEETGEWDIYSYNSGKQRTNGFEAGFNWINPSEFHLQCVVVYQKSKNLKEGYENIPLGYSPEVLMYGNFSYFLKNDFTISLLTRYTGAMETQWRTKTTPEAGSRIGNRIKSSFVFDGNLRVENIFDAGFYANLSVKNIFDTEIRYPTTTSNSWADLGTIGNSRSFLLTIGISY